MKFVSYQAVTLFRSQHTANEIFKNSHKFDPKIYRTTCFSPILVIFILAVVPIIRPERPIVRPYGSVELECRSNQPHIRPELRLLNGTPVEHLPRFEVTRPSFDVVIVRIREMTERDRNLAFQYVCFFLSVIVVFFYFFPVFPVK